MEYGLIASKSSEILADFFWQLGAAWNATPLWAIIAVALGITTMGYLFFRRTR
jgi:hypothetical protein